MRFDALSPGDRRTLIIGGSLIGVMLFAGQAVPRYLRWRDATRASVELASLALRDAQSGRLRPEDERKLRAGNLDARTALDSLLLDGSTASSAMMSLADVISEATAQSGATLGAVQVDHDSTSKTLGRVTAHAWVNGDIEQVTQFLEMIEADAPVLSITAWSIASVTQASEQQERLRLDVAVDGLWMSRAERRRE